MKIAIANFSIPQRPPSGNAKAFWAAYPMPSRGPRVSLLEQPHDWGFHLRALGVRALDVGLASSAEFWVEGDRPGAHYDSAGILWVHFTNPEDVRGYVEVHGAPDLFINHGSGGRPVVEQLAGRSFRVLIVPLRMGLDRLLNYGAECYLVDDAAYLDARSSLYVPVVNTSLFCPDHRAAVRDFIYLASVYEGKRHDLLLDAVRGTALSGHLHPVDPTTLDLSHTLMTTSRWNERDVIELLRTSRFAVYPGDHTSNPAAMWECVAAGLPIIVNRQIKGGKHLVVPGVTGELAAPADFRGAMLRMLDRYDRYQPHQYFIEHWDPIAVTDRYLEFFQTMGWRPGA